MDFKYFIRAELDRAQGRFINARREMSDAQTATRSAVMLAEHMQELYKKVNRDIRPGNTFSGQRYSDLCAAQKGWERYEGEQRRAALRETDAQREFREAQVDLRGLIECFDKVTMGKERWERVEHLPSDYEGVKYRTLYDKAQRTHHFKQTWPLPTPPRKPPRYSRGNPPSPDAPPDDTPPQSPTFRRDPSQAEINAWFASVKLALANPTTLTEFPLPPQWKCFSSPQFQRLCPPVAMGLCRCCLGRLFLKRDLKADRALFHLDKYSKVPELVQAGVQETAMTVFKWVDAKYVDMKARKEVEGAERERERRRSPW